MTMAPRVELYAPPDLLEAHRDWKANCGPAALAAITRQPLALVRPLFPGFECKPWTTPTRMQTALSIGGHRWRSTEGKGDWPSYGLAFLQIIGPWEGPGVPPRAAYRYTHWVAYAGEWDQVYDANAGAWLPRSSWEVRVMTEIVQSHKRATGWRIRSAIEVAD